MTNVGACTHVHTRLTSSLQIWFATSPPQFGPGPRPVHPRCPLRGTNGRGTGGTKSSHTLIKITTVHRQLFHASCALTRAVCVRRGEEKGG